MWACAHYGGHMPTVPGKQPGPPPLELHRARLTAESFSHVYEPPAEVAKPFAAAFSRVVPDSPFAKKRPEAAHAPTATACIRNDARAQNDLYSLLM